MGIVKSVWSFFDSDYEKSQQRKAVDKNLKKVYEQMVQDMESHIESGKKGALEKIEKLKVELNDSSIGNYERMKRQLKEAHKRLGYTSNDIKTRSKQ